MMDELTLSNAIWSSLLKLRKLGNVFANSTTRCVTRIVMPAICWKIASDIGIFFNDSTFTSCKWGKSSEIGGKEKCINSLSPNFKWVANAWLHDDVIKWKHFPRYWPFVWGIHLSLVNSLHKGQWCRALMFSLIFAWMNGWVNTREAGDLKCHCAHYDVTEMLKIGHQDKASQ